MTTEELFDQALEAVTNAGGRPKIKFVNWIQFWRDTAKELCWQIDEMVAKKVYGLDQPGMKFINLNNMKEYQKRFDELHPLKKLTKLK